MNEGFLLSICNDVTHIHVKLIKLLHCCMLHRANEQQKQQKYANLLIKSVSVFFVFIFISEIGSMLDNAFFRYFISILCIQFFSTREQASKWEKEIVEARRGERGLWRYREREQNVIINCNSNAYYKVNNVMTMNLCLRAVMRFQDW